MAYEVIINNKRLYTPHIKKVLNFLLQLDTSSPFIVIHQNKIFTPPDVLALINERIGFDAQLLLYMRLWIHDKDYIQKENKLWKRILKTSR